MITEVIKIAHKQVVINIRNIRYIMIWLSETPRDVAAGAQGRGRLGRDTEGHYEHRRHLWSAHLRAARVRREDHSAEPDS